MLSDVDSEIESHAAWSNGFFDQAASGPVWSSGDVQLFGWEYFWFTKAFPKILCQLAGRVDDDYLRGFLVEIAYSELGAQRRDAMHSELFRRLLTATTGHELPPTQVPELGATRGLISGLQSLYTRRKLPVALGAQYALEYQADNMLRRFQTGFRRMGCSEIQLKFFAVHEVDEPEHIAAMRGAVARYETDHTDRDGILIGVRRCLALFAAFWDGLDVKLKLSRL